MKLLFFLTFLVLLDSGCEMDYSDQYPYNPPEYIGDGLEVGLLDEVGLDSQLILNANGRIRSGKHGEVHSMLIYKDNKLVFEEYYPGFIYQWDAPNYQGQPVQWNRNMMHAIMSCTKSFASACIGMAIRMGYIDNVNQSIFDYLPDHQQYANGGKENISIEHLVTMTSGLAWNEWNAPHGTSANDVDRLYFDCSDDPVKCVLERPLVHTPGEFFTYNGGGTLILGEILRNATGMNIDDFSMQFLFKPMGIDSTTWYVHQNGAIATDGSLYLRSRDMLKFGITYLHNGAWMGEQIIPSEWVQKSSVIYRNNRDIKIPIEDSGKNGYGYTWWISEVGKGKHKTHAYRANGWGGQVIMVFPEKDMVVVFTSGNYASKSTLFKIVESYILPACD